MFSNLPRVTKALLIINVLVFLLQQFMPMLLEIPFALWPFDPETGVSMASGLFRPWQLLSYGFLHGDTMHVLFNMLALVMFGAQIERQWGSRRYLFYYLVCIVGAGLCQLALVSWSVAQGDMGYRTVGASGGVFGLLLAYGVMFPHQRVMLLFPPIPMKARTLVVVYGILELTLGLTGLQPGVAHFAHLGGMLFGGLVLWYWRRRPPSAPRARRASHLRVVE